MLGLKRDNETHDLRVSVIEEFESELQERVELAREEIRTELEAEFEQRAVALWASAKEDAEEALTSQRRDIEYDIDSRVEAELDRVRTQISDRYVDRLEVLQKERDTLQGRHDELEEALLALVAAVLPEPDKTYAIGRYCRLATFPLRAVNSLLAAEEQQITGTKTDTQFPVDCGNGEQYGALTRHLKWDGPPLTFPEDVDTDIVE